MKIERVVKEEIDLGDSHKIKEIKVGTKEYKLKITNFDGNLSFNFNDGEFVISINSEKGLAFSRTLYRLEHDHNNDQHYQIAVNEENAKKPVGTLEWRDRFPYRGEGWEIFRLDFGSRKEGGE